MARYPVTVGQWRAYHRTGAPVDEQSLRGEPNHPVVDVSWRDAVGYCVWLTEVLRRRAGAEAVQPAARRTVPEPLATLLLKGDEDSGPWVVTLPSEAQWEKAARGERAWIYPWGNAEDPNRANYGVRSALRSRCAVGCFPGGASPYKVEELAGNVWEWTRTERRPYPYNPADGRESMDASSSVPRVMRGGSYLYRWWYVRSAFRGQDSPNLRGGHRGFRVVVAPFPSDL